MVILGIDPSLNSTGLCILDDTEVITSTIQTYDLRGMKRLAYIERKLEKVLEVIPDLVVMEGYAMGIKGGRVFDIGELGYSIKRILHGYSLKTLIVTPTSMKKFVTGKGTADKDQIQASLLTEWDIAINQNDEADAAGLALFGYYATHRRKQRSLTEDRREALQTYEILK